MSRWQIPLVVVLAGCASSADYGISKDGGYDTGNDGVDQSPNGPGGGGAGDFDTGLGGSEDESDRLALRPAQTDIYVFVANPDRDTVTRINVRSQEVRTAAVGIDPRLVRVTPDYQRAVVFNRGDDTVHVLDASTLVSDVVPVRDNMNAMLLSPTGDWAVLWHDVSAERPDDPRPGGATSFHEVSLVNLDTLEHQPMVVGFNPKGIRFTPDGALALVYADASLAVLRLDQATPVPEYIQLADPLSPPAVEEVVVAPDGTYAFVRPFGADTLTIVDLATKVVDQVPVGLNPTDLDLLPDGTGAVVVSRGARELSVFSVADPFAAPRIVPFPADVPLGAVSMAPSGLGIVYTTASLTNRYATWDLSADVMTLRPLVKPIQSVSLTPTGTSLLVVHTKDDSPDGSTPEPYRNKNAVSLVDLGDFRANTIALSADPSGYATSADGKRGYLVLEGQPYLEVLNFQTLIFDEIPLRSDPVFVGVLPDLDTTDGDEPPAWVSQEHPLGRISFYDPDDRSLETITGFELNGAIEE